MSEKIKQFEGRSTDRNDKKVTYAHREDPNGCRFIDFANSVPGWAVDIQQYVEEEQKTMNANEMADAVYKKYCNSMDDLADKTATMLRQLHIDKHYALELVKCHEQTISNQQADIEVLKKGLEAMVIEFRQLDLPYGSKAYISAAELLWKNNERKN